MCPFSLSPGIFDRKIEILKGVFGRRSPMSDAKILELAARSCDYRLRNVHCPHKEIRAGITAAKWQIADNKWTRWTVVDCPLLPAGEIWCDMTCLSQLEH
jgi:hypothetical protein